MLIGIDGSTTATGYAFGGADDPRPRSGSWSLPGADEQVFNMTLARVMDSLAETIRLTRAKHVFIEAPLITPNRSPHTMMSLIQLTGALRGTAAKNGAKVVLCASSTVRKAFVGRGTFDKGEAKPAVMARCKALGWDFEGNDNRADAMAIWFYGMSIIHKGWADRFTPLFERAAG